MKTASPASGVATRFPTIILACHDSSAAGKAGADFVGDGTAAGDLAAMQDALDALNAGSDGGIGVLEGTLNLSSGTATVATDTTITGVGKWGTKLRDPRFTVADKFFELSNLRVENQDNAGPVIETSIISLGLRLLRLQIDDVQQLIHADYTTGTSLIYDLLLDDVVMQNCGASGVTLVDLERRTSNAGFRAVRMQSTSSGAVFLDATSGDSNNGEYMHIADSVIQGHVTIDQMYALAIAGSDFRNNLTLTDVDNYRIVGSSCESTFDDTSGCTNGAKSGNNGIV